MDVTTEVDRVLETNREFARTFASRDVPPQPRRHLLFVLCMDARIDPLRTLGLDTGDAHIIRNAGGRVADALRSIAISQSMLGTEAVLIIHHTKCGMAAPSDEVVRSAIRKTTGAWIPEIPLLTFRDLRASVQDDLRTYRACSYVRQDIMVRGFVYDVDSGLLSEVESAA